MKRLILANWKMNPRTIEEARTIASHIEHGILGLDKSGIEVAICPPFVFLPVVKHAVHFAKLGSQNVAAEEKGPHTGEVSAGQLREFNVSCAIIGHSERRSLGEDDKLVNRKIKIAIKEKIHPVLCVGYGVTKAMKESSIKALLRRQLAADLKQVKFGRGEVTIAYEPAWAISRGFGTQKPISVEHSANMLKYIKSLVPKARTIYGASVDAKKAVELASYPIIEGSLVGGASLHPAEFLGIIKAFTN